MASLVPWDRFVRYVSADTGAVRWGEPILSDRNADVELLASKGNLRVYVLEGDSFLLARPTGEVDEVRELLGPLTPAEVPMVRCVGINYMTHIREIGFETPKNPTIFFKTPHTVTDTRKPIPIPKLGQSHLDYEGELTIVIGKTAKNVSEQDALNYVAGYVAANDVSCRDWQMEPDKAGTQPQWCFSKSFDEYAPLGPQIVSAKVLEEGRGLSLTTKVNGEIRQSSNTDDLCFPVRKLVSFLSTGQTLQPGSLIMTGTPGGVAGAMDPPAFLHDGDEVVVEISGIGKVRNVMNFE